MTQLCLQANVHAFFTRPNAPRVRHLHIEAVLRPGGTTSEKWHQPPSLDWLTPVLRSARSLRLTFAPELMFSAGRGSLRERTLGALLFVCTALEALHIDLVWLFSLHRARWRDALLPRALPVTVRRLTLETSHLISLPGHQESEPLDAPEFQGLEHFELRSNEIRVESLDAFSQHRPCRLTLEAASRISVPREVASAVVHEARELVAGGLQFELCCPTQDCIGMSTVWDQTMPLTLQETQLLEELRSWFVKRSNLVQLSAEEAM